MEIVDFTNDHIEEAMMIALENYNEERQQVPILPKVDAVPELKHFAENKLGAAAFEKGKMIGFLCAYLPREDTFGTTGVRGTFSPIHAHGTIRENRDKIYSGLYQAAAEKWVKAGIASHAVALYTHDKEAVKSFFYNGFGLRCIDLIRPLEEIPVKKVTIKDSASLKYLEVQKNEWQKLLDLHNSLITYLAVSPDFMKFQLMTEEDFYSRTSKDTRYFAVKEDDRYIAYIKAGKEGENFATEDVSMMNICGAYCIPEYRGSGIYPNLLSYLVSVLKSEGYLRLGVDCESFNPCARGFWPKYFTEYTHSVVRRIDDKAVAAFGKV